MSPTFPSPMVQVLRRLAMALAIAMAASACSPAEPGEGIGVPGADDPNEAADDVEPGDTAPDTSVDTDSDPAIDPDLGDAPLPVAVSDPLLGDQWGLVATDVPVAWTSTGGDSVVIAIVDSGVDLDHPDLAENLVPGWDFVDDDDQPDDPNGHGTHVAGIAAAATNSVGIAGAAPNAKIMPVRVLDAEGAGDDETIAEAVRWAADNGADVINLSLGEAGFISRFTKGGSLNRAIRDVTGDGVVVVAASGNEGTAGQQYRIGVDVLVVNATGPNGELTSFSNVGDVRAISAPGEAILSTAPVEPTTIWPEGTNGYAELDGTSMATPLVAGIAALAISAGVSGGDVIDVLVATADNPDANPALGAGIVDAAAAVGANGTAPDAAPPADGDEQVEAPGDPAEVSPPSPDDVRARVDEALGSIDTTLAATCAVNRRTLTVTTEPVAAESDINVQLELVVVGFSGAGTYPTTGAITVQVADGESIVLPGAGQATVDDTGSGSITLSIQNLPPVTVDWAC